MEIVVARYESNLKWLDPYRHFNIRVYDKSSTGAGATGLRTSRLANIGREAHTFLTHIVSEYENLQDWTVFTQDNPPDIGYLGHRKGGGHLAFGSTFDDYLFSRRDGHYLVHTGAFHASRNSSYYSSVRRQYHHDVGRRIDKNRTSCPDASDWDMWWPMGWFEEMVTKKQREQRGMDVVDFYNALIEPERPQVDEVSVAFAQGGRMGLSRKRIHARPKAYYQRLLAQLTSTDSYAGYYMEWFWPAIFRLEPCAFTGKRRELSHNALLSPAFPPSPPSPPSAPTASPPLAPPRAATMTRAAPKKPGAPLPLIVSGASVGSALLCLCICVGLWVCVKTKQKRFCLLKCCHPCRRAAVLDVVEQPKPPPSLSKPPPSPPSPSPPPEPDAPIPPAQADAAEPAQPAPIVEGDVTLTLPSSRDDDPRLKGQNVGAARAKRPSRSDLSRRTVTASNSGRERGASESRRARAREVELARARR